MLQLGGGERRLRALLCQCAAGSQLWKFWFIALEKRPRSVPQRCEVLSLVILIFIWGIMNGTADKGLREI